MDLNCDNEDCNGNSCFMCIFAKIDVKGARQRGSCTGTKVGLTQHAASGRNGLEGGCWKEPCTKSKQVRSSTPSISYQPRQVHKKSSPLQTAELNDHGSEEKGAVVEKEQFENLYKRSSTKTSTLLEQFIADEIAKRCQLLGEFWKRHHAPSRTPQ